MEDNWVWKCKEVPKFTLSLSKVEVFLIFLPPWIFKVNYPLFFGLFSQSETTSFITETRNKIWSAVIFKKILVSKIWMMALWTIYHFEFVTTFNKKLISGCLRKIWKKSLRMLKRFNPEINSDLKLCVNIAVMEINYFK